MVGGPHAARGPQVARDCCGARRQRARPVVVASQLLWGTAPEGTACRGGLPGVVGHSARAACRGGLPGVVGHGTWLHCCLQPGVHTNVFAPIYGRRDPNLGHASLATISPKSAHISADSPGESGVAHRKVSANHNRCRS